MTIHETAVIHPNAKIDETSSVGPFCIIGEDVEIGPNCILHSHVVIITHFGDKKQRTKVYLMSLIKTPPFQKPRSILKRGV